MANINSPYGFVPLTPEMPDGGFTIATGYGTALNIGDVVAFTGTGTGMLAGIQQGTPGSDMLGVFSGCDYTDSNGQPQWAKSWPASTTATNIVARVWTNPLLEYRAQISGGTPAVTDYANKIAYVNAAGTNGISGAYLDGTGIGTGTDFQIRRGYESPLNSVGANMQVVGVFRLSSYNTPYTGV